MISKSIFTLIFLILALLVAVKVKIFIKNNAPQPVPTEEPVVAHNATTTPVSMISTIGLHEPLTINDKTFTIEAVIEDSRCPSNVQCIQAGRVRANMGIQSLMGTSTMEIEPGVPVTTENLEITLTDVLPYPNTTYQILPEEYRFTLSIKSK